MWMRGPLQYRISSGMLQQISVNVVKLRSAIPCEFARKPRTFYKIDRWKATEFRQFLLYTGPVVLNSFFYHKRCINTFCCLLLACIAACVWICVITMLYLQETV